MFEIILKWAIPTLLTALIGYIAKVLNDNKECNHATSTATVTLIDTILWKKL